MVVMAVILILTFPHRWTKRLLVDVGMILDLLSGMCLVAILTTRAPIEQAPLELGRHVRRAEHLSSRYNVRAHFCRVLEEDWISAQPSAIDLNMRKATDRRVVLVAFATPSRAELAEIRRSQLSKDVAGKRSWPTNSRMSVLVTLVIPGRTLSFLGHTRKKRYRTRSLRPGRTKRQRWRLNTGRVHVALIHRANAGRRERRRAHTDACARGGRIASADRARSLATRRGGTKAGAGWRHAAREEGLPFLGGEIQVGTVSGVADELVVAAEDVLRTPDVLVEAEEDGSLRGDVPAAATALGTAGGGAVPPALGGGDDDLLLFVLIRNLHGHLEVGPGRGQALQQDGIVAQLGGPGELDGERRAILLGTVDARDDVVKARVEDDLHAAVDLRPGDGPGGNL